MRSGLGVIDDNRLSQAIRQIEQTDDGIWIAESGSWVEGNFIAMNGGSVINSTNTYCNTEMWSKIDPSGQYEEIYNRYAHISISLIKDTPTTIELVQPDLIQLNLNIDDLELLGVKYILTPRELEEFNSEECSFVKVNNEPDFSRRIYEVQYGEQ